jgi:polyphosphate kinase
MILLVVLNMLLLFVSFAFAYALLKQKRKFLEFELMVELRFADLDKKIEEIPICPNGRVKGESDDDMPDEVRSAINQIMGQAFAKRMFGVMVRLDNDDDDKPETANLDQLNKMLAQAMKNEDYRAVADIQKQIEKLDK